MAETALSGWEKFCLISWKNWNVLFNRGKLLFLSVISPALFTFILIILRFHLNVQNQETKEYKAVDIFHMWKKIHEFQDEKDAFLEDATNGNFSHNAFVPLMSVAYAPNTKEIYNNIMENAAKYLDNVKLIGFPDSANLRESMGENHYFAGIIFAKFVASHDRKYIGDYPNYLNYTVVFPSELRIYDKSFIGSTWQTQSLYDTYYEHKHGTTAALANGYMEYLREGFLALQHAVSLAYIVLVAQTDIEEIPHIAVQSFPKKAAVLDPLINDINLSMSLIILMGFFYPCVNFIKYVVFEKGYILKNSFNILGMGGTVQFFAWFIRGFLPMLAGSVFVVTLFKIQWTDGIAIFNKSSWFALLLLMIAYNIASVCFCFMIATFIKKISTALLMLTVLWILTYLPYVMIQIELDLNIFEFITICFFFNSIMALAFDKVLDLEKFDNGLQFQSYFKARTVNWNRSVGALVIILLLQAVLYTLIGCVVQNFSRWCSVKWDSFVYFNRRFLKILKINSKDQHNAELRRKSSATNLRTKAQLFEIEGSHKKVIVEIKDLSKSIENTKLVDNVSMNLCEGEITILMGHNGSGKSLLLSMIVGRILPTSGSVFVLGSDISKYYESTSSYLGISLNDNMLFPDLTVEEQIGFFSRIKGLKGEKLKFEVQKYLKVMNLENQSQTITRRLSIGLKRTLCACCALCGSSKVIVLDEPSTGIDLTARKILWDLLLKERHNRTILITTHSIEEAEILGDRIAIMSGGKLRCFGSTYFITQLYGRGKRLVCIKDDGCDEDAVTKTVRKYIGNVILESDIGNEFTYRLTSVHTPKLIELLSQLERNFDKLKLNSCAISEPSIEDVFFSLGGDDEGDEKGTKRLSQLYNGVTIFTKDFETLTFLQEYKPHTGLRLLFRQCLTQFKKRFYFTRAFFLVFVIEILLPALVTFMLFALRQLTFDYRVLTEPMTISLLQYPKTITVIDSIGIKDSIPLRMLKSSYYDVVVRNGIEHLIMHTIDVPFSEFILSRSTDMNTNDQNYLAGVSIEEDKLTAWFNNKMLHTAPLSLNILHNAILDFFLGKNARIAVIFDPLPLETKSNADNVLFHLNTDIIFTFALTYLMCCTCSRVIQFQAHERLSRLKLMEYINGLRPTTFLFGNILFDLIKGLLMTSLICLIIICFQIYHQSEYNIAAYYFFVLVIFSVCFAPFVYCMGALFRSAHTGFYASFFYNIFGSVAFIVFMDLMETRYVFSLDAAHPAAWIIHIFPFFSLCQALIKILNASRVREICSDKNIHMISTVLEQCKAKPDCCYVPYELEWNNRYCIFPELISVTMFGTFWAIVFLLIEYDIIFKIFKRSCLQLWHRRLLKSYSTYLPQSLFYGKDTLDVEREQIEVSKLIPSERTQIPIVINNLSVVYNGVVAVNRLYLIVNRSDCLGLLGVNLSGKSAIIKTIIGDTKLIHGHIYVNGIDISSNLSSAYKHLGFSPNMNAIPQVLKCHELMEILCHLRGMPRQYITESCQSLAKAMGLMNSYYQYIGRLSTGTKCRLTTAISIIGNPSIILFDETLSGVDPIGVRQFLNIICRMCKMGKTVVFTTLNTTICERICTRIAFLSNGAIQCIDTSHNVKKRIMTGYQLSVRVKLTASLKKLLSESSSLLTNHSVPNAEKKLNNPFLKVQTFVEQEFKNAVVKDQRGKIVIFFVPNQSTTISELYGKMEANAFNLNVESFSISHTTLEMAFCDFIEKEPEAKINTSN